MDHSFSVYIPIDRYHAMARGEALPGRTSGAALLADISGFTPLAEALAQRPGPLRGAEELTAQLNQVYSALITEVHRYGGSVIGFSGDAITCWFDGDSGLRGIACALAMQAAMCRFATVTTSAGATVSLAVKIAVVAGPVRRFLVGDPQIQRIDVLAGRTLDTLAAAEHLAERGDVIVDAPTIERLGAEIAVAVWREDRQSGQRFAVVAALGRVVDPAPWPAVAGEVSQAQARMWLLRPVYERLRRGPDQFLAELRPAVALFLSFGGIDYDQNDDAGNLLDAYVRWVQQSVARYEGVLLDVTMGDKGSYMYIAFGAPIAHDDDAARALAAALDLRHLPPSLNVIGGVRMGLAQGSMYTGTYGGPARHTYGVLGNKVNLAARLMELAAPGTILCDDEVYRHAQRRWAFEALPPVRVKGKAGLLRVYRPTGAPATGPQPPQRSGLPALVGRTAEIAQVEAALQALKGGAGQVLCIEGEAGIGKSRLVAELIWLAREHGLTGLLGAGQSIEPQTPYRAWRDIFSSYFDLDEISELAERQARVRGLVQELAPQQVQRLPLLNDLLNLGLPDTPLTAALEPVLRQESLTMFLVGLLSAWVQERPLILVLEDAHWLDSLSWALVLQVARTLSSAGRPLLLVLLSRPLDEQSIGAQPAAALRALDAASVIRLAPLSSDETVELVTARLALPSGSLPEAVAALVRERSGGVPFFAEEMVFMLRDQGVITIEPDASAPDSSRSARCVVSGDLHTASQTLPDTLRGLILARIDRLPPETHFTLKVASVIGRSFGYTPLYHTLNHYTTAVEQTVRAHLDDLARRDLTVLETHEPDPTYVFKHVITQEVAYQTLLFAQRKPIHRIVAAWYEATFGASDSGQSSSDQLAPYYPLLVYHYHQAEDAERERWYAIVAGKHAAARYANAEALSYFSRALVLTPEHDRAGRYDLLLAREKVYDVQGAHAAQRQDLDALTALAAELADDRRRAEVALRQSAHAEVIGDYPTASAAAQQAVELARAAGAMPIAAAGYLWWGTMLWFQGNPAARARLEHALELARATSLRDVEAKSLSTLGHVAWSEGNYTAARAAYDHALHLFREIGDRRGESAALNSLGIVAEILSDYRQAHAYYEHALRIRRELGDRRGESKALISLGSLFDYQGDYTSARSYYEQSLRLYREIGDRPGEGEVLKYLSLLFHHLGDDATACEYGERALLIARELGAPDDQVRALVPLGNALAGLERMEAAAERYQQALALRHELSQPNLAMEPLAGLARMALAQGNLSQARAHVAEILDFLETTSMDGTDEPFRVYLTCYQVLDAAHDPRAPDIVSKAYGLLHERAANIDDESLRRSFLENIAAHRELTQAFEAICV